MEGGDVIKDGMADDDALDRVTLQNLFQVLALYRIVLLVCPYQPTVPERPLVPVQESGQRRKRFPLALAHEESLAYFLIDLRDRQILVIEHSAQPGMNVQVSSDDLDRVACLKPASKLGVWTEELRISHPQLLRQTLVLLLRVAKVVRQNHRLMVAQKERDASAGFLRLIFQLVDQPEDLGRVFAPVKNVTDDDQMIPAEAPMQVLVNHSVAAQQADDAIHPAVRVGHYKHLFGAGSLPHGTADRMKPHFERIVPVMIRDAEAEVLRQGLVGPVDDVLVLVHTYDPGAAVRTIEDVWPVY